MTRTIDLPPDLEKTVREQAVLDHVVSGVPVDPQFRKRVRERAEAIRRQILATHGVQDIGVDLIRERRGELPES